MDASTEVRPRRQDRSTVPCLILLVACVAFAYGLSSDDPWIQWGIPSCLAAVAVAYGLWPRLARRGQPQA